MSKESLPYFLVVGVVAVVAIVMLVLQADPATDETIVTGQAVAGCPEKSLGVLCGIDARNKNWVYQYTLFQNSDCSTTEIDVQNCGTSQTSCLKSVGCCGEEIQSSLCKGNTVVERILNTCTAVQTQQKKECGDKRCVTHEGKSWCAAVAQSATCQAGALRTKCVASTKTVKGADPQTIITEKCLADGSGWVQAVSTLCPNGKTCSEGKCV